MLLFFVLDLGPINITADDWILGNVNQYGVYRVTYDNDNWNALMSQLKRRHKVRPYV